MIADIVAVSDQGLIKENPHDALAEELRMTVKPYKEKGLKGSFSIAVGHDSMKIFRGSKSMKMKLPPQGEFRRQIFNADFKSYIHEVIKAPRVVREYVIRNKSIDLTITFHPGATTSVNRYPAYRNAHSKRQNPIFSALEAKSDKLKSVPRDGIKGIILCDANCELLQRYRPDWSSYSVDEIIDAFLKLKDHINFVLTLTLKHDKHSFNVYPRPVHIEPRLYVNTYSRVPSPELCTILEGIVNMLPHPQKTAISARNDLARKKKTEHWYESSLYGGLSVSQRKITISSRKVLELLAGRVEIKKFNQEYDGHNPFAQKLEQGMLIKSVQIEKSDILEYDDDYLVIEFTDPDSSVIQFNINSKN